MVSDVTSEEFEQKVIVASNNKLILVDFWATWCGPCKALTPVLESIANSLNDKIDLVKINTEENKDLATKYQISSIPNVKIFKDGEVIDEFVGALPEAAIKTLLEKYIPNETVTRALTLIEEKSFDEALALFKDKKDLTVIEQQVIFGLMKAFCADLPLSKEKIIRIASYFPTISKFHQEKELLKNTLESSNDNILGLISKVVNPQTETESLDAMVELVANSNPKEKDANKNILLSAFILLEEKKQLVNEYRKKLSRVLF